MLRVNTVRQAGQQYEIPESIGNDYYFSAKLVTFGKPGFDPVLAGGRVSRDDYMRLRAKILQAAGSLGIYAKWVFYLRFIIAGFSIVFCALRTTLRLVRDGSLSHLDPYIMMAVLIIPNLIINCIWSRVANKLTKRIQDVLNDENTNTFREKGVSWKISSNLLYMHLTLINDGSYRPPLLSENVLTSYPIKMQPPRRVPEEPYQPSATDQRFPGLVLAQRQDYPLYPNTQDQQQVVPLNPNPSPPLNPQPLRTMNSNVINSQPSETWDYRS